MEILIALFLIILIGLWLRSPADKGRRGERRVGRTIARGLDPDEYVVFDDLVLETPDGTTQIDHVIVSPFGVFVIETKNYSGWIFGDLKSRTWTQVLYRKKSRFQNPLHQNFKHVKAVETLLSLNEGAIHSVVAFVGKAEFKTDLPWNVVSLKELVPYIRSKNQRILGDQQVEDIAEKLSSHKAVQGSTSSRPTKSLGPNQEPICPRCGNPMV